MKMLKENKNTHCYNFSRRKFLYANIAFYFSFFSKNVPAMEANNLILFEEKLLSILNKETSVKVGLAIMDEHKMGIHRSQLSSAIRDNLGLHPYSVNAIDKKQLTLLLKQQTTKDFNSKRIIKVKGWSLGYTEALLCTLVAHAYHS